MSAIVRKHPLFVTPVLGTTVREAGLPTAQVATFESVGEQRVRDIGLDPEAQDPVTGNALPRYCPGTWFTEKSRDMVYTSTMAGSRRESHAVDGDVPREGANEVCDGG